MTLFTRFVCFRQFAVLSLCSFFWLSAPFCAFGQDPDHLKPVSRVYALVDITIIPAPGKKIDKGTIVIKNGLIDGVGKNIPIPPDAIVMHLDSMYAYAGLIDGFSHTGVTPLVVEKQEKVKYPGNPPPDRAGITPQRDVVDFLSPSDPSITQLRNEGFATAQVVPHGNLLPGRSAVILLGGETVGEMILKPNTAFYSDLIGAGGVYPSTIMGVMAKWRELYRQAYLAQEYEALYRTGPVGRERPQSNEVLESFYPVIDKTLPVLFKAEKVLEVQRVFSLQRELGFHLAVADLKEGFPIVEKVKKATANVFLSLDLPKELEKPKKKDSAKTISAEKKALRERQEKSIMNYTSQAALFSNQGIRFGFSANTVKPKNIRPHLRRMIAAGLSEQKALAALTTVPAQLLGLEDRLGTIEKGKIANLLVSDKPYFEDKSNIKYVFVDGRQYEVDKKKKSTGEVSIVGSWSYSTDSPELKINGVVVIKSDDANHYSGTITNSYTNEESILNNFLLNGNEVSFTHIVNVDGGPLEVSVEFSLDGDSFEGTLSTDDTSFPIKGNKMPESTI